MESLSLHLSKWLYDNFNQNKKSPGFFVESGAFLCFRIDGICQFQYNINVHL